ncbi:MAG: DUF1570 domain-containing protein [Planctomycetaceae bacterium]|nr:DUF1570 domain-containing protein [Planctomycetaceae bacterium]
MADYLRGEPAVRSVEEWKNPYAPGLCIATTHYELYTTLIEPLMLRQLPAFLESAYAAYQNQLPAPIGAGQPLKTYFFSDRAQWEQYTRDTAGTDAEVYLQIVKGAYTLNGTVVAYNIGRKQSFAVIGHEGWHQFDQRLFVYRLPSWLDEGIATLFETCSYTQGKFVFEPQRNLMRLGALRQTVLENRLLPLRELIALNPGQLLEGSDDAILSFYAQNYALVRFLRENNYGVRLASYRRLLQGGAGGSWPLHGDYAAMAADRTRSLTVGWNMQVSPALFTCYIDPDLDRLNAEYRAYCAKLVYHVRIAP